MNKFKTGEKWLRSDGKVCLIDVVANFIFDQDATSYFNDGSRADGNNLVSRVVSDDEHVQAFIDYALTNKSDTLSQIELPIVAKRLQAQSKLLEELKQLIADSGEKGAAMITKIEEL